MKDSFKDKNIIITGGTEGFGKNIIENLVIRGANIAFCARSLEKVDQLSQSLNNKKIVIK